VAVYSVTTGKTLAMSGPTASNRLNVCGVMVATSIGNALKRQIENYAPSCNSTLLEGEKSHPASYRGCSHVKGELQRGREQQSPKASSGRTFFSKFTSA
jgi:hypothetical protein